jgi:hypothetical protein
MIMHKDQLSDADLDLVIGGDGKAIEGYSTIGETRNNNNIMPSQVDRGCSATESNSAFAFCSRA